MSRFADDGYCFVCGPENPAGLKLDFTFDGEKISTVYTPRKEHQGYKDIVHGGIVATVLDEVMVKLAIELGMPAVTAQMDIRLKKAARVGERITVTAKLSEVKKKLLFAVARAELDDNTLVAEARGKLVRIQID
jgi:acyl-coenzyme A thioesterase PaaI-like protein